MTLDKVKEKITRDRGLQKSFVFKGSRNQMDHFEGIITNVYPAIFTVTLNNKMIKSFSYSDVLIENLRIID